MHLLIIGGSDAGISAALRARELAPTVDTTVVVADAYPNYSICGIPYHLSGEVPDWHALAHRTRADLEATGMQLLLEHTAVAVDPGAHTVLVTDRHGSTHQLPYDRLMIGTGAVPMQPRIAGLTTLGPADGVHLLHTMDDTFALAASLTRRSVRTAVIVGAGYIGLEMVEALVQRGLQVTVVEQLPQVLATVDPALAAHVAAELTSHGVEVVLDTLVQAIERDGEALLVRGANGFQRRAGVVLVVVGVRPDTALATAAGVTTGSKGALAVNRRMETNLPDVFAAGDCVETYHHLLGATTYLPLGTTAHKQGRVAGENAVGGDREFAGSLGTQVVKVFGLHVARTGLRDHEARAAGFTPLTTAAVADDHKAYYPGAQPIAMHWTGDTSSGRLLGVQLAGRSESQVAKRIDVTATALFHGMTVEAVSDLDLSYTPPLGSPWDALQLGAQAWVRAVGDRLAPPPPPV
jgi:NADPH-dependent 2,4-dienoyl-CoA reductase/sulfur reductase-like enzyme